MEIFTYPTYIMPLTQAKLKTWDAVNKFGWLFFGELRIQLHQSQFPLAPRSLQVNFAGQTIEFDPANIIEVRIKSLTTKRPRKIRTLSKFKIVKPPKE